MRKEEIRKVGVFQHITNVDSQDPEDNWVWQAELEPGQGGESGVYGLQVALIPFAKLGMNWSGYPTNFQK